MADVKVVKIYLGRGSWGVIHKASFLRACGRCGKPVYVDHYHHGSYWIVTARCATCGRELAQTWNIEESEDRPCAYCGRPSVWRRLLFVGATRTRRAVVTDCPSCEKVVFDFESGDFDERI